MLLPRCANLSKIQMVKYIFHTLCMHTWCAIFHTLSILTFQGKKCTHGLPSPMLKETQNLHHKILNCAVDLPRTLRHSEEARTFLPPKKAGTQGTGAPRRLLWLEKRNYLLMLLIDSEEYEIRADYWWILSSCATGDVFFITPRVTQSPLQNSPLRISQLFANFIKAQKTFFLD